MTLFDVEVNVLHTSLVLDVLGHCIIHLGKESHIYVLPILHKILLKIGNYNIDTTFLCYNTNKTCILFCITANPKLFVQQAAFFTLKALKESLGFKNYEELIGHYIDYLTFQLNLMIKKVKLHFL